ncbi:hypothetical protein NXX09_19865 [Bacteroides uniformis]|nr:hypothetical protein [Bacteroides uniformis]
MSPYERARGCHFISHPAKVAPCPVYPARSSPCGVVRKKIILAGGCGIFFRQTLRIRTRDSQAGEK